jgi:hypothetical protein
VEGHLVQQERKGNAAKAAELDAKIKEIETKNEELVHQRRLMAKVTRVFPETSRSYLQLTIAASAPNCIFGLREFDAQGKEVLALSMMDPTKDGEKVARILARSKADPAGPTGIHVVVDPRVSLGWGMIAGLKACETAGYKSVKFTGYIPKGGKAQPLRSDQRGEVPGYKRYDGVERTPESLIEEIIEGMRTY